MAVVSDFVDELASQVGTAVVASDGDVDVVGPVVDAGVVGAYGAALRESEEAGVSFT